MIIARINVKGENQNFPRNITAKVGRLSYLNLNFLTKGLTDLLRSKTKRSLRPTTTEKGKYFYHTSIQIYSVKAHEQP